MNDVLSMFLGWTALLAGVWFLFEKSESVASQDTRLRIARWLKRLDLDVTTSRWPTTFISLFDSVFGKRHLSWLCFLRSCVASSCVVAMVLLVWAAFHWNSVRIMMKLGARASTVFVGLLIATTCMSLIPDYVSLLKTRYILQRMRGMRSYARVAGLLALDLLATGCLALGVYAGAWWSFVFLSKATGSQPMPPSLLPMVVNTILTGNFGYLFFTPPGYQGTFRVADGIPLALWFIAAFFASMWAALYALSVAAVRMAHAFGVGIAASRNLLDIEEKPITSLGWVAMLLVSIGYWIVALIHRR
jgi:hypothetical protein